MHLVGFIIRIYHDALFDIHHCCVYSEELLMMDKGTVRNMWSFILKINFEKLVHLVGFVIKITMAVWSSPSGHQNVGLCNVKNRYTLGCEKQSN